jgi:hypothetical protein
VDETSLASALQLNLPKDLQRYARFQEPDWDCPIEQWVQALLPLSQQELADIDAFATLLRFFVSRCRALEPRTATVEQAAVEADRLLRYQDLYAAQAEAARCIDELDPATRQYLIGADIFDASELDTALAEAVRTTAQAFLRQARATWVKLASERPVEGMPADWYEADPWLRRDMIIVVRANTSFASPG